MKKILLGIFIFCLTTGTAAAATFTLTSPDIKYGVMLMNEQVYNGFGCTGKISPLHFNGKIPRKEPKVLHLRYSIRMP